MINRMEKALGIRRELKAQETPASLLQAAKREIEIKKSKDPLLTKPDDVFASMKSGNEIRGNYAKLEFLKLKEDDLAIAITDIHGDREKLQAVLDYIKSKRAEIKGDIHLINMGDTSSGASGAEEDVEAIFDLLKGNKNGEYKLHMLRGNVERDAQPATGLFDKIKNDDQGTSVFPAMTDLLEALPSTLFLETENGPIMLTHSTLPLVNKKRFEREGLGIFSRSAGEIDGLGMREPSGTWATFDGEREESAYGGKKMFQLGKDTFRSIFKTLDLKIILRGHDSSLIKKKAKETGVHQSILENGEVDTFHTSRKATGDIGIFAEITADGEVEFKKV